MGSGEWDLTRLSKNRAELDSKINILRASLKRFEALRPKLNSNIDVKDFATALKELEKINEIESVINHYCSLKYSEDTQHEENSSLKTLSTRIHSEMLNKTEFFLNWWKRDVDPENANRLIRAAGPLGYYLKHQRDTAKYSLPESEEKIVNTLSSTGVDALVKLYITITSGYEFKLKSGGKLKTYTKEDIISLIKASYDPKVRAAAYEALLAEYKNNSKVLGDIYQNCALAWRDNYIGLRRYHSPISARNMINELDDGVVEALLKSCRSNLEPFREFFRLKAKEVGMKKLARYDIYAPLKTKAVGKEYAYKDASRLIPEIWGELSPKLKSYASRVINEQYIDYGMRKGKRGGAFSAGVIPSMPSYVLLSYGNDLRSLSTLAHELGHAIHYSAASDKSILTVNAPLPLAESASTFSEALLFDRLTRDLDKVSLRGLLFNKFDDYYATIMRQAYFTIFEIDAHEKIANGTTTSELNELYMRNLKEQFGNSVDVGKSFEAEWTSIPHIYHTPFYCYSYSFGLLLALALFQRYKHEGKPFSKDLEGILSAGASKNSEALLKEYGIDISSSKFWDSGFDYIKTQLAVLKKGS